MANKAADIDRYPFSKTDLLFLDANVWLSVYGPQKPGDRRAAIYSRGFDRMLKAGSKIHFDVIVASEFVNRFFRLRHGQMDRSKVSSDFKTWRGSSTFTEVAKDVGSQLRRILSHSERVQCTFADCDIQGVIAEHEAGKSDFNDQLIADLCLKRGLALVTDDGDFSGNVHTPIITGNRSLLSK